MRVRMCAYAHVHNTQMGKLLNNNIMHISTRTAAAAAATAVIVFVRLRVTDYIHIMFGYYVGSQLIHSHTHTDAIVFNYESVALGPCVVVLCTWKVPTLIQIVSASLIVHTALQ